MNHTINTGIIAALVFIALGFYIEGGDHLAAWLPQRVVIGFVIGIVVVLLAAMAKLWKTTR